MMRLYYIFVGCFSIPGVAVERVFATYYVSDYEKNSRKYIALILIAIINIMAFFFMFTFIYGRKLLKILGIIGKL